MSAAVFYVYVIRSQATGRTYVGHTSDLAKRLSEHNDTENHSSRFCQTEPRALEFCLRGKVPDTEGSFSPRTLAHRKGNARGMSKNLEISGDLSDLRGFSSQVQHEEAENK